MDLPKLFTCFLVFMTSLSRGAFFPEKSFSTPEARFYGFMSVSFAKLGKVNDFFGEKYKL